MAKLDHLVGQQPKAPPLSALWRLRASQGDQMGFFLSLNLAVVVAVGLFPVEGPPKPFGVEEAPHASNGPGADLTCFGGLIVGERRAVLVDLQQNPSSGNAAGRGLAGANQILEHLALFVREANVIFLVHGAKKRR